LLPSGAALPEPKWFATEHLSKKFDYNNESRSYHALVPDGYPGNGPYPVIVLFHGNGADAAAFYYETYMGRVGRLAGYILVFAEGIAKTNSTLRSKERSWNGGTCCDEAFLAGVDDTAYAGAVITDLPKKFAADAKRVFLAGVSNGGSIVLRIACELPHLVAGVASVVGSLENRDGRSCGTDCTVWKTDPDEYNVCAWNEESPGCSTSSWQGALPTIYECSAIAKKQVPLLTFHGNIDPSCNVSGQVYIPKTQAGYYETYSPSSYISDHFRRAYKCSDDAHAVTFKNGTHGNSTVCHSWTGCTNVTHCLSDAGHRWFGDIYNITEVCMWEGYNASDCLFSTDLANYGPQTVSVSATEQIVEFFDAIPAIEDSAIVV
jgi:poly(3-hydroxybutyrate) depolymerase